MYRQKADPGLVASIAFAAFFAPVFVLGIVGCSKKLDPEAKKALAIIATASNERRASFELILPDLACASAKPEEVAAFGRWTQDYKLGCERQARALAALVEAVSKIDKLQNETLVQLQEAAETARGRAENFQAMLKFIAAKDPANAAKVDDWKTVNAAGLTALAEGMTALSRKAPPKGSEPKKPVNMP